MSDSLLPHGLQHARLLCPWDFPGKNRRVGCCFLLQGILPNQGLNLGLLYCGQILYRLSHKGSIMNNGIVNICVHVSVLNTCFQFSGRYGGVVILCLLFWRTVKNFFIKKNIFCDIPHGILVPQPRIEPRPWQWECRVLITGPQGNSLFSIEATLFYVPSARCVCAPISHPGQRGCCYFPFIYIIVVLVSSVQFSHSVVSDCL